VNVCIGAISDKDAAKDASSGALDDEVGAERRSDPTTIHPHPHL